MEKLAVWLMLAVMFCAALSAGCGGSSSSSDNVDAEQQEDTSYNPNSEGRGFPRATVDLSTLTKDYTAQNRELLTGTLRQNVKVSIADGAMVTIKDVTINGVNDESLGWAGLTCEGSATIILEGTNYVRGFYDEWPGIYVPEDGTLTITGNGALAASSTGYAAGIGGGWFQPCGNIVLGGGAITATGGKWAAGIGSGSDGTCGTITISEDVLMVRAIQGEDAPNSIGAGHGGTCGTVMIGGVEGEIAGPCTYPQAIDLATVGNFYTAQDKAILTGTFSKNSYLAIAYGATVVLLDATIDGKTSLRKDMRVRCEGDATIILAGDNTIKSIHANYPALLIPHGKTLTIKGTGSLTASSSGKGAAIGGGYSVRGGNIVIDGGTITASGGKGAAAIGGSAASCGDITINRGTITATGGRNAAAIGSGAGGECGNITITKNVVIVNATKGIDAPYSIGAGKDGSCGTITIGGQVTGDISTSPYPDKP